MVSSFDEAVKYLYSRLPMFHRIGPAAIRKDLTNTLLLCEATGNPHKRLKFLHVAGTNGKGSSSHLLASILQEAGFTTGLYTSPHLKSFTERIKVNGREIDQAYIIDFINRFESAIERIQPSFFEVTVVMALDYFALRSVDIAVMEVGLGGRLDSTNIINPLGCLITNIGWDHMDLLGDTLEAIAGDKAGIIKPTVPVVVSEFQEEVAHVFRKRASEVEAPLRFASTTHSARLNQDRQLIIHREGRPRLGPLHFPLQGDYQLKNVAGVCAFIDILQSRDMTVSDEQLTRGIERVLINTGLKGRWQKLREHPLVIVDTGHNADGLRVTMRQLEMLPHSKLHIVFGVVRDKSLDRILPLLPRDAAYYFCQAEIPRALDAEVLHRAAVVAGLSGVVIRDVNAAYREALSHAAAEDVVFVGGSTFVVAELEEL
jgi:dihydrofolate synthase/folylpolyglutamate synthase